MPASVREFFEGLEARLDPARLEGVSGSYRFDVQGAGSWRVDVEGGRAVVSQRDDPADCVISLKEETMLRLVRGEQSPVTAFMTGKVKVDGDMGLALKLRDLFA